MKAANEDAFYVGYLPLPRAWRGAVKVLAAAAALAAIAAALLFAFAQPPGGDGGWSTATIELDGVLTAHPYAMLHGADPQAPTEPRAWLLVATGKAGVAERVEAVLAGASQRRVRVRGLALQRRGQRALELVDGPTAIEVLGDAAPLPASTLARVTVVGEIIDPKCWLGAMRPGSGLVHRACASLCIRSGVPPCFIGAPPGEAPRFWVLTDPAGSPCNEAGADCAGVLVRVEGTAARLGNVDILRIDPAAIAVATRSR